MRNEKSKSSPNKTKWESSLKTLQMGILINVATIWPHEAHASRPRHGHPPGPCNRSPVDRLRPGLHGKAFRHIGQRLEVAFDQGLHEETRLVLGVAFGHVHHERLDHQRAGPPVDDLRVKSYDGRIVLEWNWNTSIIKLPKLNTQDTSNSSN